jgi:hypothetical protein
MYTPEQGVLYMTAPLATGAYYHVCLAGADSMPGGRWRKANNGVGKVPERPPHRGSLFRQHEVFKKQSYRLWFQPC